MNKLIIIITLGFLILSCNERVGKILTIHNSTTETDSLTAQLQEIQDKNTLPGFAVSIFTKDEILYQKGFGYADIKSKIKKTLFSRKRPNNCINNKDLNWSIPYESF